MRQSLANRVAHLAWRLRRVDRFETASLANFQRRAAGDYALGARAGTAERQPTGRAK